MQQRIVHLTTAHPRGDVRIFLKECATLADAGYDVQLLVADGLGEGKAQGVSISDAGTAIGRFQRMIVLPWRMLRLAKRLRGDVYHFHDPELLLIALPLKATGAHVIYDSHEDVPRAIMSREWIQSGLRRLVSVVFEKFENFVAARITAVIGATDHIAKRFSAVNPRTLAINNFPLDSEIFTEVARAGQEPAVCYVGGISRARGIFEMVRAMELVNARLLLAGPFETPETERAVRALPGWSKVDYRGTVSRAEVREIMAASVAGLLFFHPEPNHVDAQPNKMFEYMSAGLPVLASDFPLWRRILEKSNAGAHADPLDAGAIASLIQRVLSDATTWAAMGERGRQAVLCEFCWRSEASKLIRLYGELLA